MITEGHLHGEGVSDETVVVLGCLWGWLNGQIEGGESLVSLDWMRRAAWVVTHNAVEGDAFEFGHEFLVVVSKEPRRGTRACGMGAWGVGGIKSFANSSDFRRRQV